MERPPEIVAFCKAVAVVEIAEVNRLYVSIGKRLVTKTATLRACFVTLFNARTRPTSPRRKKGARVPRACIN